MLLQICLGLGHICLGFFELARLDQLGIFLLDGSEGLHQRVGVLALELGIKHTYYIIVYRGSHLYGFAFGRGILLVAATCQGSHGEDAGKEKQFLHILIFIGYRPESLVCKDSILLL